jgi:hypothetical protein
MAKSITKTVSMKPREKKALRLEPSGALIALQMPVATVCVR